MTLPAYPEYKDSLSACEHAQAGGVEWLGEIPTHWGVAPLKRKFLSVNGSTPKSSEETFWGNEYIWITPADLSQLDVSEIYDSSRKITTEGLASCGTSLVPEGSLVVSCRAPIGAIALAGKELCTNQGCKTLVVDAPEVYSPFYYYVLEASNCQLNALGCGTTFMELSSQSLGMYPAPIPSIVEQQAIADYLDKKTGQIDALIGKKKELIERLKEQRTAIITHAVTKGIPENGDQKSAVKMKDSGVEWLGEVPAHWEIKKLRFLGACQNGINIEGTKFGTGHPFVSYGDVYNNHVLPVVPSGLVESTDIDRKRYSVQEGDVFFTRTSETIEEIGFASTCLASIEDATFAGFLIRFRPEANDLDPDFSKHFFRNNRLQGFFIERMNLVTRASLSQELLKSMPVLLPPLKEQRKIVDYLDEKSGLIDGLIEKAEEAIQRLEEYRTAVITAAVTGKVKVG